MEVNENLTEEVVENTQEEADEEAVLNINVDELSEEDAKNMLKEVLEANDELVSELNVARKESDDFKDKWYRTTAEFENYKKRNSELRKTAFDDGKIEAIKKIFVVGDSLDRALTMQMDDVTKSGVELIQKQFVETLRSIGVEEINPVGEVFSPETAEAIAMVDPVEGEESGTIRTVFKKGYKLNGKTMRYAQVIVVN